MGHQAAWDLYIEGAAFPTFCSLVGLYCLLRALRNQIHILDGATTMPRWLFTGLGLALQLPAIGYFALGRRVIESSPPF